MSGSTGHIDDNLKTWLPGWEALEGDYPDDTSAQKILPEDSLMKAACCKIIELKEVIDKNATFLKAVGRKEISHEDCLYSRKIEIIKANIAAVVSFVAAPAMIATFAVLCAVFGTLVILTNPWVILLSGGVLLSIAAADFLAETIIRAQGYKRLIKSGLTDLDIQKLTYQINESAKLAQSFINTYDETQQNSSDVEISDSDEEYDGSQSLLIPDIHDLRNCLRENEVFKKTYPLANDGQHSFQEYFRDFLNHVSSSSTQQAVYSPYEDL